MPWFTWSLLFAYSFVCGGFQNQQQLSKSANDVSDIVEVESMAGMTEEEKIRARYVHKRRSASCVLVHKWK